jgi:osmotically-inducible protein OsmY
MKRIKKRIHRVNRFLDRFNLLRDVLLAVTATVVACGFTAACNTNAHPDDKQAIYNALDQHQLSSVMVNQDRENGVVKLSGIVGSADSKGRAQQLAQQAAPGYTIDNRLQVNQTDISSAASASDRGAAAKAIPADSRPQKQ